VVTPTALVLGPTGLAHDRATDILYVASTADNAIFAVPQASVRKTDAGTGAMIAKDGQLRGPLALALAPNGDLITSNGDAVNADPPSLAKSSNWPSQERSSASLTHLRQLTRGRF
jgi:hypothetical protein